MRVFSLRRTKESRAFSHRNVRIVSIELASGERLQYQSMVQQISIQLSEAPKSNTSRSSQVILKGINRLMQFCSYGLVSPDDEQDCQHLSGDLSLPYQASHALSTSDLVTDRITQQLEIFNDADCLHTYDKPDTPALLEGELSADWSNLAMSEDGSFGTQHVNRSTQIGTNDAHTSFQLSSKLTAVLSELVKLAQASLPPTGSPEKR